VPLALDLDPRAHTLLEEYRDELGGVVVEAEPVRYYPGLPDFPDLGGRLMAHVLGQVRKADRGPGLVGTSGIERAFQEDLEGEPGIRQVEVDPLGRPYRVLREKMPRPGNDLVLTLDAFLQAVAERALLQRMEELRRLRSKDCPQGCPADFGAAVVLRVDTGEVLVLASVPAFDPNLFATRAHARPGSAVHRAFLVEWQKLKSDPAQPLYNHATQTTAPPGSTFKLVTAASALRSRAASPQEVIFCPGKRYFGGIEFGDWAVHGPVNMVRALLRSCNVYFYEMGLRVGIGRLEEMAREFGLGEKTGLEAYQGLDEEPGWVAGPATKEKLHPEEPRWNPGDVLSAAIGQGDNRFTPLQMAVLAAAVANGGKVLRPYVVKEVRDPRGNVLRRFGPEVRKEVRLNPREWQVLRQGMEGVMEPGGTAAHVFADFPALTSRVLGREIHLAGKTGTAQAGKRDIPWGWFVGYAPADKPEIAVAVMVRRGGGGSLAAGPVARAIFDAYFGVRNLAKDAPGDGGGMVSPSEN
jgi:penicillin-binding protein 2